jgi:hypothetical protein
VRSAEHSILTLLDFNVFFFIVQLFSPILASISRLHRSLTNRNGVTKDDVNDAIADLENSVLFHIDTGDKLPPSLKNDIRTQVVKLCRSFNFSKHQAELVEGIIESIHNELNITMPSSMKVHIRGFLQSRARDSHHNR